MSKITIKEMRKTLESLENQGYGDLPVIYSIDDEGNAYHKVNNLPSLCGAYDIKESRYLKLKGFYNGDDEDSDAIKKEQINCVIIN